MTLQNVCIFASSSFRSIIDAIRRRCSVMHEMKDPPRLIRKGRKRINDYGPMPCSHAGYFKGIS